jgi:hypothetical protein
MSAITDAVFGGSAKDASKAQIAATEKGMVEYKKGIADAKTDINKYSGQATDSRLQRTQQAFDVMGQGFTPALDTMNQGNMQAQQTLSGAAPQMQNAILGNAVDYSSLQPQGINFDAQSFLGGMPSVYDPNTNSTQQPSATPQPPSNFDIFSEANNLPTSQPVPPEILNNILNPYQPSNYNNLLTDGTAAMGGGFQQSPNYADLPRGGGMGGGGLGGGGGSASGIGMGGGMGGGSSLNGYRGNYDSIQPSTLPYNPTTFTAR